MAITLDLLPWPSKPPYAPPNLMPAASPLGISSSPSYYPCRLERRKTDNQYSPANGHQQRRVLFLISYKEICGNKTLPERSGALGFFLLQLSRKVTLFSDLTTRKIGMGGSAKVPSGWEIRSSFFTRGPQVRTKARGQPLLQCGFVSMVSLITVGAVTSCYQWQPPLESLCDLMIQQPSSECYHLLEFRSS
eukprot:TRINITY_DN26813_c0_g1_i1.p2 TRINITY_DN26813_c0_g1~~TRINITY_DN26813_c0_g1_i1.p2  ORF type:complete len:191 (+),score=20.11 TRINITY_DN26813_c0_g1_i1:484-1056(+)